MTFKVELTGKQTLKTTIEIEAANQEEACSRALLAWEMGVLKNLPWSRASLLEIEGAQLATKETSEVEVLAMPTFDEDPSDQAPPGLTLHLHVDSVVLDRLNEISDQMLGNNGPDYLPDDNDTFDPFAEE